MDQRVYECFPESPAVVIRDRNTEESHLDLLLIDASFEKQIDFLKNLQQRFPEEFIDPNIRAFQDLKGRFMGRYVLSQNSFATHEKKAGDRWSLNPFDDGDQTQCTVQLFVSQWKQ
jgi:hypothetical protein